ncbi:MAG: glutathione S-transferase family protein [Planctomycetota bacterium]
MSKDTMAQFPKEQGRRGEFVRQESVFRDHVRDVSDAPYPAVAGRYHLYVSYACPWAHRTILYRRLLGLEDAIGMTVVDPIRDERGWAFREGRGHSKDPVNGFEYLSEAYRASTDDFDGRVTVPVLWDKETKRVVNNESSDIIRMLGNEFRGVAKTWVDFYPEALRSEIDALNQRIYDNVNNGVYRAGFATSQEAYEDAVHSLFEVLDELDARLADRPYLHGEQLTETDWRLFTTLIRFDPVYVGHFKCNVRRIADYENLSPYLRRLYQTEGVASTVDFDHIKRHYYITHRRLNPTGIVPVGPELSLGE